MSLFLIHFTQQQVIVIKAPFLNSYSQLVKGDNWLKWRPDLKQLQLSDTTKISLERDSNSFTVNYPNGKLEVTTNGNNLNVKEISNNISTAYSYDILPDKLPKNTLLLVNKRVSLARYLIVKLRPVTFSETHAADFKKFMETDSLLYGCKIVKTGVPGANLAVIRKIVPNSEKFIQAAKNFSTLQKYIADRNIHQINPLIAQFLPRGKDSTQVNVGFFIDQEIVTDNVISFVKMPRGGPLYAARFAGPFNKRQKVYAGLQAYFTDHLYQSAILPFETYLDNKLPTSETDVINMQLNFTAYY